MDMKKPFLKAILMVVLSATLVPCAGAEGKEKPWKRFSLNVGASFIANDSEVRLGLDSVGAIIDVEKLLDLESTTSAFRLDGYWRFSKNRRHRLDFSWFSIRRTGDNVLGLKNPIDIGDITLELNARVQTQFDIDIYQVGYSYSFFQDDRLDLAIGAGLFVLPISLDLQVTNPGVGTFASTSESITAPLPVFNVRGDVAITPKWFFRSRAQLFYLELGEFRGGVFDTTLGVEYLPFRNVGFGFNVERLEIAVEAEGSDYPGVDFVGLIDYNYIGAMLYMKFFFGK